MKNLVDLKTLSGCVDIKFQQSYPNYFKEVGGTKSKVELQGNTKKVP